MFRILVYNANVYYPNKILNYNDFSKLIISSFLQEVQSTFLRLSRNAEPSPLSFLLQTCYIQWAGETATELSCPCALQCCPAVLALLRPSLQLVGTSACGREERNTAHTFNSVAGTKSEKEETTHQFIKAVCFKMEKNTNGLFC